MKIHQTEQVGSSKEFVPKEIFFQKEGWLEITADSSIVLDLKYATPDNFLSQVIYPCGRCFLREEVAEALFSAQEQLSKHGLKFKLFDCYRPLPAQRLLWNVMPNASYVTPPSKGSMHNRGMAVDITLVDMNDQEKDMGSPFDHFGIEAHSDNLSLPDDVLANRKILASIMIKAGFKGIRTEWWHYSFVGDPHPLADWEWPCND